LFLTYSEILVDNHDLKFRSDVWNGKQPGVNGMHSLKGANRQQLNNLKKVARATRKKMHCKNSDITEHGTATE